MKGITPVVAIILLLLITIAVIGFAFGYFSSIAQTTGGATTEQAEATTGRATSMIEIEACSEVAGDCVAYLYGAGIEDVTNVDATARFYVADVLFPDSPDTEIVCAPDALAAGSTSACTLNTGCADAMLKVVGPGGLAFEKKCS